VLNLTSFHICAYMESAVGHRGYLAETMMKEIEAEQLAFAIGESKLGEFTKA
jgi:hypothetical protein